MLPLTHSPYWYAGCYADVRTWHTLLILLQIYISDGQPRQLDHVVEFIVHSSCLPHEIITLVKNFSVTNWADEVEASAYIQEAIQNCVCFFKHSAQMDLNGYILLEQEKTLHRLLEHDDTHAALLCATGLVLGINSVVH